MALRRLQCRAHPGGIFSIHPKRGRQPVSCAPANPCDKRLTNQTETPETQPNRFAGVDLRTAKQKAQNAPTAVSHLNPCLPLAMAAKERLETVGWVVKGKAGIDETHAWASITASREHETLNMLWSDGELAGQNYAMEFEKPSANNYPENDLHFDPAELSDSELVRMIKGMRVTWWNTIASSRETAVAGGNITVEHIFFANGDEDNSKRIVKFIDHGGGGFRAFHVSALLKVG